ncbi:hypothetical protein Tco_0588056 [Tanacetum coccineum]
MESLNSNFQEQRLTVATKCKTKQRKVAHDIISPTSFTSPDHLEKQLDKEEFQETESIDGFRVLMKQFQTFINFRYCFDDLDVAMIRKSFLEYTRTEIQQFRDTLIQHMESVKKSIDERATKVKHKRENNRKVNDRVMQSKEGKVDSSKALDAGLVVTESNETKSERHVSSSRSGKDTHAEDADINSVNDKQPLAEINEKLHKENEHLKQTYKDLYDSIKTIRVQTKDHNDSLIAQINSKTVENADLKAQIQEKVFANVALKNELRKLKGNSVDTKFAKPSILGKPVLQPPRNQSVVRQPNAF